MEKPLYPSPYMRITQGYLTGTHAASYALDDAGIDTGIDHIIAPFTGIIRKIYTVSNEVWLESLDKVEYPDGTIDYMTILFCHDNDVSNLFVGKVVNKGEQFYQEGTKGNASGNHVHFECAQGKFTGTGWHKNDAGYWSINNGKRPEDCLWIDDSIKIINSNGYIFKLIEEEVEEEIIEDNTNEEEVEDNTSEDTGDTNTDQSIDSGNNVIDDEEIFEETPRLIFTCKKDDLYGIYLKEGQKLYLE